MEAPERLDSWKEIAAYLKRDVRTVQRWEASESLPVHRHQHQKRGSVYALRHELDAWRESRRAELFNTRDADAPGPDAVPAAAPPRRRTVWAGLGAALIIAGLLMGIRWVNGEPAAVTPADPAAVDAPRLFGDVLREGAVIDRIALAGVGNGLTLSPDGAMLYVSVCSPASASVQAIDLRARTTKWTVEQLRWCGRVKVSPDARRLYAVDGPDVAVIDTGSGAVRRIRTPAALLNDLALTRDGATLYAAAAFKGLLALDTASGSVETLSSLPCPMHVALAPSGERLYVNYQCGGPGGVPGHDAIDIVDTRTRQSVGVIRGLPNVAGDIIVTRDGSQVWADGADACRSQYYDHAGCPDGAGAIVNVIRASDHSPVRSLRVGPKDEYNVGLSTGADGSRMIVGRLHATVISTATLREVESVPLGLHGNVEFANDGRTAYVLLGDPRSVAVVPLSARPAPPAGLTARWTMDGLTLDGVAENDFAPAAVDGFAPGTIGLAARMPAMPTLRLDRPTNLFIENGWMTSMAWVKVDGPPPDADMTILEYAAEEGGARGGWRLVRRADGRAAFCIGMIDAGCDGAGMTIVGGAGQLTSGGWHHIAVTRDPATVTLYVDGRAEATGAAPTRGVYFQSLWLRVGSSEHGPAPFLGRIDEVEIYNRPLSAGEIAARARR